MGSRGAGPATDYPEEMKDHPALSQGAAAHSISDQAAKELWRKGEENSREERTGKEGREGERGGAGREERREQRRGGEQPEEQLPHQ